MHGCTDTLSHTRIRRATDAKRDREIKGEGENKIKE